MSAAAESTHAKAAAKIQKLIKKKEKELIKKEDKILALQDEITFVKKTLKEKRVGEKSTRVAAIRLDTHHSYYATDLKKRPPDRSDDIRIYSKMDLDIWGSKEVRQWFNSYATDEDFSYKLRPHETGYMIRND